MPNRKISPEDYERLIQSELAEKYSPILKPKELAELFGVSVKTIYFWVSEGRLDGTFRKRGKHCLIWRDRAIDRIMNGKNWS